MKTGANLLRRYLQRSRLQQAQFAASIRHTESAVSRWLSGERQPGLDAACAIEKVTRGAVPVVSWIQR